MRFSLTLIASAIALVSAQESTKVKLEVVLCKYVDDAFRMLVIFIIAGTLTLADSALLSRPPTTPVSQSLLSSPRTVASGTTLSRVYVNVCMNVAKIV